MSYRVLAPLAFVVDGKVKHYPRAGAVIDDVPSSEAEHLVASGKLIETGLSKLTKPELVERAEAAGISAEVAEELPKRELTKKLKGDAEA